MQGEHDVIDLSRPIHTNMPVFPLVLKTYLGIYMEHKDSFRPPNISSQSNILIMSDHAGTHIDSPIHFNPDGTSIDQMPLEVMVGNAVMQDFSSKKSGDTVTTSEVKERLDRAGVTPKDLEYILFRTGAAELYNTDQYFSHYLEIHVDTVEWMLDQGILVFGVDASTCDHASDRKTHMLMRKRPCYHIENLMNLEKLPQDRVFTFVCTPLILVGSSASPVRALALVEKLEPDSALFTRPE
ncbi:cyclase family protein [Chloroflexota bacterium]